MRYIRNLFIVLLVLLPLQVQAASLGNYTDLSNWADLSNYTDLSNVTEIGPFGSTGGNLIGAPGALGFGVGVASTLPSGMSTLTGTADISSDEYGNYQYVDGSVMVYVPKFYYKVGTGSNGLAVNVTDIKGTDTYASTAVANAAGYALHRAFIDNGSEQDGFFFDKYENSKTASGAGFIASSIKNGLPLSTHADHNPIADLTSVTTNNYYQAITAAHARDGVDGAVNSSSIFHLGSMYQYSALAMLSLAHGQAATSTDTAAWYDATYNFPKGNNNNALKDTNDTTVIWESDGYSNAGKTGSAGFGGGAGNEFSKSTHNGQANGIADLNGNTWELGLGMTAIAAGKTITGVTQANPAVVTATGHGYTTGDVVMILSVVGMTEINNIIHQITVIDADNYSLDGVDATGYTAYTSAGSSTKGVFYAAKETTRMADFTSGNTGATDNWGATGVAAMMDEIDMPLLGPVSRKLGNAGNQILSEAISGTDYVKTGLGLPQDTDGFSAAGTNLFGTDYYYQYVRNELFPLLGGDWSYSTAAGVWARRWSSPRTSTSGAVGFRSACYFD